MPPSALRFRMAKQTGEALVEKEGLSSLPVDPFKIANRHEIIVEAKPDTADGVSGMLLRYGDLFGIMYATHIPSEGFQRFSVAHELGHYFLEGHIDHVFANSDMHTSQAGFSSQDPYELEADHFAAGLLMPDKLFRREHAKYEPGLQTIEAMADLCRTSLTATALRYAELTEDAVVVVMSTGQIVDFCRMSESMKSKGRFDWIRKSTPVPRSTGTYQFNANTGRVLGAEREVQDVDLVEWLGGDRSVLGTEEIAGLGRYGKTLTVLTCPTLEDIAEEEDVDATEEDMVAHWGHRFRRDD